MVGEVGADEYVMGPLRTVPRVVWFVAAIVALYLGLRVFGQGITHVGGQVGKAVVKVPTTHASP